jgi:hypothetical protein
MDERTLHNFIERGVVALERMAEDPVVEMEAGPPVCPHCSAFNPEIAVREEEARGPISGYIVNARCLSCGQEFYAVPHTWRMFTQRAEVEEEMEARRRVNQQPH